MSILKKAPPGSTVVDLVANRAARAETRAAAGEGLPLIHLDAGFIQVKAEVDLLCAEDLFAGRFRTGLAKLLADPADVEALVEYGLSKDDLEAITTLITGDTLGESLASPKSSPTSGMS